MITTLNLRHKSNYVLNITEYPFVLKSGYWIATYASDKKNIETTNAPASGLGNRFIFMLSGRLSEPLVRHMQLCRMSRCLP